VVSNGFDVCRTFSTGAAEASSSQTNTDETASAASAGGVDVRTTKLDEFDGSKHIHGVSSDDGAGMHPRGAEYPLLLHVQRSMAARRQSAHAQSSQQV